MIKTKKQMYLVIGAFALVLMLGTVTYAFFNYTRTGSANTIRVGRIAFNTSQASGQDASINLSNAFPITRAMAATDTTNTGEVVITITGDTTYSGGVEYLVTATDVTNTVNSKTVPISIIATASNGLGTSDDSYFTNRGGNSSIYKVLANETISNNDQLLVGYIAPDNNQTGVNGTITIRAYLDSDLVVISDTYNNGNTPTDNLGTPASFGEGKTVLSTTEWNSLTGNNALSFKVKVVAQEGTWVEEVRTVNAMINICQSGNSIEAQKGNIKEVYFNKMGATAMQTAYDNATIKADLTDNNEGKVLAWLETNQTDNTKYNLIVASDGDTYFPTSAAGMFYRFSNMTKIEFNNINTSRLTDTGGMFDSCSNLINLDLSLFDTSSVTNAASMFAQCSSLTTIYVSNLWSTSSLPDNNFIPLFSGCSSLVGTSPNGTRYEYDNSKTGKNMSVIATDTTPGYLTDISLKPTN